MGLFFNEDINTLFVGGTEVSAVYLGSEQVWPIGLPVGTVFDFGYTGNVQSVELPRGKYKLQCWGAQGGTSYGSSNGAGSKGGYSEGVLTLTQKTVLYVFVGGQGSRGSGYSLVNGGWNGGGASVGHASYSSGDIDGESYPACGGGSTDISTVSSSMDYSGGRTNRSSASLLSRFIVAGGGAGGSYRYTSETTTNTTTKTKTSVASPSTYSDATGYSYGQSTANMKNAINGTVYASSSYSGTCYFYVYDSSGSIVARGDFVGSYSFTYPSSGSWIQTYWVGDLRGNSSANITFSWEELSSSTSTSTSSGYSNKSQQGGGTSGNGQYPGTQSSAGNGGGFGYGANQETTNYRYCSGAGGGGWYGGGKGYSDSSTSYVNYSGGGSGFVNTAANASYRPSGYTGLQLDSGTTTAGNNSHPSISGGSETGHSGDGYARITVIQ